MANKTTIPTARIENDGENLSLQERLAIAEKRPLPSTKEWMALWLVWAFRFTSELDKPVSARWLKFLRQHLSPILFADLTDSLSSTYAEIFGKAELVDMWEIKMALNRKSRISRLRKMLGEREAILKAQRAIANQ